MNRLDPMGGASTDLATASSVSTRSPVAAAGWYVVQTKRHREHVAQRILGERGTPSYLPRIVQWPRPAVGSEIGPMFPGYLFVQVDLPHDFYQVMWTPGVKSFVAFGDLPAPLDPAVIQFLRDREGPDHVIRCGEGVSMNSRVLIVNGPFRGLTAIVEQRLPARERVRVLMHVLQRETRVELPERWLRQA